MKYESIPYVVLVKVEDKWGLWGVSGDKHDTAFAHKMYDEANYEEKRLLHFGEVIRERKKIITSNADVQIINSTQLLNMLESVSS